MCRPATIALATGCVLTAIANHCQAVSFTGVNLAGAEFGSRLPGTYNSDYTYPTTAEINYFVGKGIEYVSRAVPLGTSATHAQRRVQLNWSLVV